jgi:alkylation response protein AidB-like acyl-CoA dehydrogenase
MRPDLEWDATQRALADAVAAWCADHCTPAVLRACDGCFPREPWKGLAELGVLALGSAEGEGGALELAAACEALGRAAFPGPLAATFLATHALAGAERAAVAAGEAIVSLGAPPLLPWAAEARVFLAAEGGRLWRVRPVGPVEPLTTLGGEAWGRAEVERVEELPDAGRALAVHDAALAAWLAAAGRRLVDDSAAHARTRRQFGQPIGDFQAVALPLADCAIALDAACALARSAAFALDAGASDAGARAAAARLSAERAAVAAAHAAHQTFGALGVTRDGPVFEVSRRIRQQACAPPPPARGAVLDLFLAGSAPASAGAAP